MQNESLWYVELEDAVGIDILCALSRSAASAVVAAAPGRFACIFR